ncbi:MAG: hypothetical protein WBN75_01250 [Verrucomicrobiia bacterium]|jgi:hypothetical protein
MAQSSLAVRVLAALTAVDDIASPDGWIAGGDNETHGNKVATIRTFGGISTTKWT